MTREKTRRSFLKMDSMQTSTKTARKIASAVGTVITKATWSSTFWKKTWGGGRAKDSEPHGQNYLRYSIRRNSCLERKLASPERDK